jgi:hypothetical protein
MQVPDCIVAFVETGHANQIRTHPAMKQERHMLRQHIYTIATVLTLGVATLGMTTNADAARGDGQRGDRGGQHDSDDNRGDHQTNRPNRERDQAHNNHGRNDRAVHRSGQRNGHYQGHKKSHKKAGKQANRSHRQHARNNQYGRHYAKNSNRYYNKHYRKHYRNAHGRHVNRHYTNYRYYSNNYNHYRSWQPYFGNVWNTHYLTGRQRANGCHPVVKMRGDRYNGRLVGATMCYDNWGDAYIVPRTKSVLYRYH